MDVHYSCKIWFKTFFGIYLVLTFVDCELIANNTMSVTNYYPLGDGLWRADATCYTNFPGKSYLANEAWMFTRFGVPVTSYMDYLAGNSIDMGPESQWVISRIGYGSGSYTLTYSYEIRYDVWLGPNPPTGDCFQFTDYTEAQAFAASMDLLHDTPADTLISTANFIPSSPGQGQCDLQHSGIKYGEREGNILVDFTVPVTYVTDYIGNTVLQEASDKTWYIVQAAYAREHSSSYDVQFSFLTGDTDLSGARCFLYVSYNDAMTASSQIGATTTPVPATTVPTTPIQTSDQTTPGVTHISTASPGQVTTVVASTMTPGSNERTGHLYESLGMRNQYVQFDLLWKKQTTSLLNCARLCIRDDNCASVSHHATNFECTAHNQVHQSGANEPGILYYVVTK